MAIIIPVILCGGSGTRLWPASREQHPKQFLPLIDDSSLLQNTMLRALRICGSTSEHLVTVTLSSLADKVRSQLNAIDPAATQHILCEPSARNTAPAVAYAASYIHRTFGKDTVMWVLPADHHIGDEDAMRAAFQQGLRASNDGYLVTFGINPTRPETGYGYIRLGQKFQNGATYSAASFVEKPDIATANAYLADGNYLWNSGMFLFSTAALLEEYRNHSADTLEKVNLALDQESRWPEAFESHYSAIPEAPFDKAIMEKSTRVAIVPCNPAWSDIGSWESLWEIRDKDDDGNVIEGNAFCHNTQDCLIHAQKRLIACAGVKNLVIVETEDALLVANRSDGDAMRLLVRALKKSGHTEMAHQAPANLDYPVKNKKVSVSA